MKVFDHIGSLHDVLRYIKATNLVLASPVSYVGTVKLDGTNAGVRLDSGSILPQSRNRQISAEDDNYGFAKFVSTPSVQRVFQNIFATYQILYSLPPDCPITLFGEWCGEGISKGVAIASVPRQFVLFDAFVETWDGEGMYLTPLESLNKTAHDNNIYTIREAPSWKIEINFSDPDSVRNAAKFIEEETLYVEQECPWAKRFGVSGIGEGIVWAPVGLPGLDPALWFKSKGEKHKTVKSKNKVQIAPEPLEGVSSFVDFALTDVRLEQGIEIVGSLEPRCIPQFLKWVADDVQRECAAELEANALDWKAVLPTLQKKAREFFLTKGREV